MKLAKDITGMFKRTLYGRAGDPVKVISVHGCILIVESESGERFPVNSEEVSEKLPREEKELATVITAAPAEAITKKKKSVPSKSLPGQQNLF